MESAKGSSISKPILCMKLRYWLYLILLFQYILIVFLFGCMGTRRWVRKGNDISEWEGGLLSITSSVSNYYNLSYKEAEDRACSENPDHKLCDLFGKLYSAGVGYLFFELIALIFIFIWIFQVALALMEKPVNRWWVAFLWPGISLLCHIIAISIWAGVTKAEFENNCLGLNSSKLCSTNGPSISILTIFLYLLFGAIYAFVHIFRDGVVKKKAEAENNEQRV